MLIESNGKARAVFIGAVPEELKRHPFETYLGWFGSYHNAAQALSRSGVNVALAPLIDLEFNRSKSAMKYLEYGACKIVGIFSDVEAYSQQVQHMKNGFKVSNHSQEKWDQALRFMVENPEKRNSMRDAAHQDVIKNHSIGEKMHDFLRDI